MASRRRRIAGWASALALLAGASAGEAAYAQTLQPVGAVEFAGELAQPKQLSGAAILGDLLVICPDEGRRINVLKDEGSGIYRAVASPELLEEDVELDLEAAASDGAHLYVIGSHSIHRKKLEEDRPYDENRERMARIEPHEASYRIFQLELAGDGKIVEQQERSLRELLESNEGAAPFLEVPSKENGVDIEGLAVKNGRLYVGFRGPVLREEYVPVVAMDFDDAEVSELVFMRLGGRGVRDMVAVEDGFLVLGGPVGDGDGTFRIYHWNGKDCVPGEGSPGGEVRLLGELAGSAGLKPEGLALLAETATTWRCLVVSDGSRTGQILELSRSH